MASGGRVALAIGCGALLATGACSDLFGLDPKQDAPVDASAIAPEATSESGTTDPGDGDGTSSDGGGGGGQDSGGGGGDARPADSGKTDSSNLDAGAVDASCANVGPVPDGSPQTYYGSCVPHLTANEAICNQYGYTGDLGVTPLSIQIQKSTCANLNGTWADAPCDLTGAVFGCESMSNTGFVCETVSITWFLAPHTVAEEDADCPASTGTVVLP